MHVILRVGNAAANGREQAEAGDDVEKCRRFNDGNYSGGRSH